MATIGTADLLIEYLHGGERDAHAVLLLHGWPDDASTWNEIGPALHAAALRTVAPMLRGFGGTRFRSDDAPRTANPGILALDAIALMDTLGVAHFMVAGHDWGASVAEALEGGWPDRG